MYRKDDDNNLFEFIDSLGSEIGKKKHIVIFYEEPECTRSIEFRFIKNGLLKQEHCIYTIAEDKDISFIEREMNDYGIDVDKYKNHLLHIYSAPYPLANQKDIVKNRETTMKMILARLKPPFRIISTLVPEVKTKEQIKANIDIEHRIHYHFNQFPGSFICGYHVKNIINDITGEWMRNILLNHHTAIFLPTVSTGLILNLS
jgi:hypothetical protein